MVEMGIKHCMRGDVFQIVLSRKFCQDFSGDEFMVYRHLRSTPHPIYFSLIMEILRFLVAHLKLR